MRGDPRTRNERVSNTRQRRQQHLLEVTVRRDKAVQQRNRAIIVFTCKLIFFGTLVGGAWVGSKEALRRFVWENPDYCLTDVRVPADGALTREQILTAAGIVEGQNIFSIDLTAARDRIDRLPQVDRVEIQRVLPNRIDINIIERRPIAWVTARSDEDPSASDKSFLIDARGVVMRSKTVLQEYFHLPIISGVEVENLVPGQKVTSMEMQAALDLVRLNADSTRFQVRNIDISKGYCLVVTDRTLAQITFGLDRIDLQLEQLNRLLDHFVPRQREIQTVNLLVGRNVPVTFAPPTEVPTEPVGEALLPNEETAREKYLQTQKAANKPTAAVPSLSAKAGTTKAKKSTPASSRSPVNAVKKRFKANG